ncbi:hypothetical protein ASZ90_014840 [hydrocarbon metagenome]|uniref:Uncharacterized protein n=1 Tax=hydrocarbon metagenome TaxID=938273 RepID=A0A0W8F3Q1_9ZZZZ
MNQSFSPLCRGSARIGMVTMVPAKAGITTVFNHTSVSRAGISMECRNANREM